MNDAALWNVADVRAPTTADGIVTGKVWLTLRDVDFPAPGWTDFPLSVLSSAVTAYETICGGELEAFSYLFDGPYYLYYRRALAPEPTVYIEANCDRDESAVTSIVTGKVSLEELRGSLLKAVGAIHDQVVAGPYAGDSVRIAAKLTTSLSGSGSAFQG